MPLYDYRCASCGKITEVRHGFDESHTQPCAACGGAMSRVFNAAPILFKGSGFYVTDSRSSSSANANPSSASSSSDAASSASTPSSSSGDSAA